MWVGNSQSRISEATKSFPEAIPQKNSRGSSPAKARMAWVSSSPLSGDLWGPFQVTQNRNRPGTAGASPDPTDSHLPRNPLPDPRMEIPVSRRLLHTGTPGMEGLVLLGFTLQRESWEKKRHWGKKKIFPCRRISGLHLAGKN